MNPTKGTPTVNCSCGWGCNCSCNCSCICNCDCILFFLLYYRECYANFRNRECRPESVVRCPYPVSFVVVVASCAKVLGTEMKFNWICIGIRLNRLCKHFVSFHLRAFRFLGSLTVNSAMWMCESFSSPPHLSLTLLHANLWPCLAFNLVPHLPHPRLTHFAPFDLPARRFWLLFLRFSAFPLRSGKITLKSLESWFWRSSNLHNSHMFVLVCACLCLFMPARRVFVPSYI